MRIMMRHAADDYAAVQIANGMESAGADVFSVTYSGESIHHGALAPHSRFVVWAKVESDSDIDAVDAAVDKELRT